MECYEGATMIKTFRGLLADGAQDTIVLHTNDGSIGYRILKFQLMATTPIAGDSENVMKIYKVKQGTPDATVDFADNTLLAAAVWTNRDIAYYVQGDMTPATIFDQEIFNQDIYVTNASGTGTESVNYYIELEQVKLDLSESTVATLKDIRNEHRIPPG